MTKNPKNVEIFLNNFLNKLKPLLQKELNILLEYKRKEVRKLLKMLQIVKFSYFIFPQVQ